jgi:UDP-N-acetylglucosamine acyltransferase
VPLDIPVVLDRLRHRYPSLLVDSVVEHEPGRRVRAVKNVTVNEEYFQGHFPGNPLMPGVMMIETLMQVATLLLLGPSSDVPTGRAALRGVNNAKFRKQVFPGDRLCLDVTLRSRDEGEAVLRGVATVDDQTVAEAELLVGIEQSAYIDKTAKVHEDAVIGPETVVGPNAIVGAGVRMGRGCRVGASAIVDGDTELGDECEIFPFASVGLIPQDLKYEGESSRLVIGDRNQFREFSTVNRGTAFGGGITRIGDDNLFMTQTHVGHDSQVGSRTVFTNGGTLAGHVEVEDDATIGAFSAVHQFCRVGRHAYIGGYSVITMDALPFCITVGIKPACMGVNRIGLERKGKSAEDIRSIERAVRVLTRSRRNTTQALEELDAEHAGHADVDALVAFIRSSDRGFIRSARRGSRGARS